MGEWGVTVLCGLAVVLCVTLAAITLVDIVNGFRE